MPCSFDPHARLSSTTWRSADNLLTPASNERFSLLTNLQTGAGCGHCRSTVIGVAWASRRYVLCLPCSLAFFGAPNLSIYFPEIFRASTMSEDEAYEDRPTRLETKRDKDFDPRYYKRYVHSEDLDGRNGCAGYRCETYLASEQRRIPAREPFMLGDSSRGHLCMACFEKLKVKFEALPERVECPHCHRRVQESRMIAACQEPRQEYARICGTCATDYYMPAPETNGSHILREYAVYAMVRDTPDSPQRRVYASGHWAEAHWFQGRECWYATQEELDTELFSQDLDYRDTRITNNLETTMFPYGTNIIKMHGFPSVTKRTDLCFGVELEMQPNANHNHAQVISALGGKWVVERPYILCRDSSIGEAGVELITLPYTLANHKSDKYVPWKKVLYDLRQCAKSGKGTTQCGMHVHINRRALSHLQIGKMLVAINAPEMQELIVTIAQRNETSYSHRYFKKVSEGGKLIGTHTDALNVSNHKGTVELRIFRGNLRYERVMKNLEFAEALCMYALDQSIQRIHMPAEMLSWLEKRRAFYPYLVAFLDEEYRPTPAFARTAARYRANKSWDEAPGRVNCEVTEGDI